MSTDHIEVEIASLNADATKWADASRAQRSLARAVSDLTLSVSDLHPLAGSRESAHGAYEAFIAQLRETLENGARAAADGSEALTHISKGYIENERAADEIALQLLKELPYGGDT